MILVGNILFLALLFLFFSQRKTLTPLKSWFIPLILFRMLAGILVGVLYLFYYQGGDTLQFHLEAMKLSQLARTDITAFLDFILNSKSGDIQLQYTHQPRAMFFVKIISGFHLVTGDNYWLTAAYCSIFSFFGLWRLANTLVVHLSVDKVAVIFSLFLLPGVAFWTAGVLKESIAMGSLAYLVASVLLYCYSGRKVTLLALLADLLMIVLLCKLKYYYAAVFGAVAATFIIGHWLSRKLSIHGKMLQVSVFLGILIILLIGTIQLHPNLAIGSLPMVIEHNYRVLAARSAAGSYIIYENMAPTWSAILYYVPKALAAALFRPFVWEGGNILQFLAGIEKLLISLLFLSGLWYAVRLRSVTYPLLVMAGSIFVAIMAIFLALSTPNFGTLMRFGSLYTPFLILLLTVHNPFFQKLSHRWFEDA